MRAENKKKRKLSLSTRILIGMGLGFGVGIFFGEYCSFLQIIGNAFIKLLQITILPYITVSMILGIGGLTADQAKLMAQKAGILLLLFWDGEDGSDGDGDALACEVGVGGESEPFGELL